MVAALGVVQILGWGTSFYFPAVFAGPIQAETGWPLTYIVGGVTLGLLVAGLISPQVGSIIARRSPRAVVGLSSVLYACGLALIGLASALPVYLAGWIVLGVGMGTGLYDAIFAALGKLYGHAARVPITNLTLFGGFSSTVCWPLSAFLIGSFGWRNACFVYAAMHLFVALPLQLAVLRERPASPLADDPAHAPVQQAAVPAPIARQPLVFVLLALILSIAAGIGSIVVVHLMIFLQARGVEFATAVWLGTLFGPAQVFARVIERIFGAAYHPIWTLIACCALMTIGLALLLDGRAPLLLAILVYGGGYGISWIARGTLPLALFGSARYPVLIGRLAFPSLIVQALAPVLGAFLIDAHGPGAMLGVLTVLAALNVVLVAALWGACRARG